MNTSIVFLVVWLSTNSPIMTDPVGQFVSTHQSMRQCNAVADEMVAHNSSLKGRVSCMQFVAALKDAGEGI